MFRQNIPVNRRKFIAALTWQATTLGVAGPRWLRAGESASGEKLPVVRQITKGPRFHWFGYYDKLQFSADHRFVLGNEVAFEGRSPTADDVIRVGMVDLRDGDRWLELGSTRAWNWQQGCMLQWLPGREREVIWNDREGENFVARILDVRTRKLRTLPDPNRDVSAPEDAGVWRMDLRTGKQKLLFSFADAVKVPFTGRPESAFQPGAKHWFNHLLFNPDATRFFFLHRWRNADQPPPGFHTRAFTCDRDGRNWHCLDPHGATSHFI